MCSSKDNYLFNTIDDMLSFADNFQPSDNKIITTEFDVDLGIESKLSLNVPENDPTKITIENTQEIAPQESVNII